VILACPAGTLRATGTDANGVFHGCEPPPIISELGGDGGVSGGDGPSACLNPNAIADNIPNDRPLAAPWSTSFEDGFCGDGDRVLLCTSGLRLPRGDVARA
jgi:hypothetical protein